LPLGENQKGKKKNGFILGEWTEQGPVRKRKKSFKGRKNHSVSGKHMGYDSGAKEQTSKTELVSKFKVGEWACEGSL